LLHRQVNLILRIIINLLDLLCSVKEKEKGESYRSVRGGCRGLEGRAGRAGTTGRDLDGPKERTEFRLRRRGPRYEEIAVLCFLADRMGPDLRPLRTLILPIRSCTPRLNGYREKKRGEREG
jgi:hypothetical protein